MDWQDEINKKNSSVGCGQSMIDRIKNYKT